jgi:carboxyl-terminal processing protease
MSCEKNLIKEEFGDTPIEVYDAFWTEFDQFYGAFEAKGINWDSLKIVCGENLNASSGDLELYHSICRLLASLNDGHADVSPPRYKRYRSWNRRDKSFFSDSVTRDAQLINLLYNVIEYNYLYDFQTDVSTGYLYLKGKIDYESYTIGYIHIPTFSSKYLGDIVEEAANEFNQLDAVIIDVRFNGGGETRNYLHALNLFCTESKLYIKSKFRNGKNHGDFTEMFEHYTNPSSQGYKNKPIAILANSFTSSSSEYFILGLKTQDQVILVGDTTCGAFSQVHSRILPNGWSFRLGSQVVYTPEGQLYTTAGGDYIEGHGIAPDFYITDKFKRVEDGYDNPLGKAVHELNLILSD